MSGFNADFNQSGNSVFENVYIYGILDYEFEDLVVQNLDVKKDLNVDQSLTVLEESWFGGIATFKDDVIIEGRLYLDYLTINKEFEVGAGGTVFTAKATTPGSNVGIGTTIPLEKFQINTGNSSLVVTGFGTVGIGTTTPFGDWTVGNSEFDEVAQGKLKLDISETVHIGRNIYDSVGSPGANNYWLKRDEYGIRWQPIPPSADQEGIKVQDEGEYIPLTGTAQVFDTLNFTQGNSLGIGSDTLVPTASLPDWIEAISDREGTINAGSNIVSISTASILTGQIIIPDIENPASLIGTDTYITSIGVGTIALSTSSLLGINTTVNWDIGKYDYSGVATITTFDLWGFEGSGNDASIYRMTNVGINTTIPATSFQVGETGDDTFVVTSVGNVGIGVTTPLVGLDVHKNTYLRGTLDVDGHTELNTTLNVDGNATFQSNVTINADDKFFKIQNNSSVDKFTVDTDNGNTIIKGTLDVDGISNFNNAADSSTYTDGSVIVDGGVGINLKLNIGGITKVHSEVDSTTTTTGALQVVGGTGIAKKLNIGGITKVHSNATSTDSSEGALQVVGGTGLQENLNVAGVVKVENENDSVSKDTGSVIIEGGVGIEKNVTVGGVLDLESSLKDINDDTGVGVCKTDYRLASVGTGVSWRPSGVETKNAIWVSMNGCDINTGLLEGDAKRTIGAAASIAEAGDTIIVRSGVYYENNPIGLRTEVTVSGEDLRLVTVVPNNVNKDVFQVRAGCLIQNMNFAGKTTSTDHVGCGAVAFPPTAVGVSGGTDYQAITGYTALGPANQGPDRVDPSKGARYRSPYVRNCTNFMTGSVGMKINGDYVNAAFTGTNNLGQDLKSMVCDSFTQYNEAGVGVSLTNNAYAQLVSIFTIGCDVAISCSSGGQCDLTNSNSSFGNVGLKADGYGDIEFTGSVYTNVGAEQDSFVLNNVVDIQGNYRKPFDGQGAYFHLNLEEYADVSATGIITQPLQLIRGIDIIDGGSGYSETAPPVVTVEDPLGPESILPEFSANVSAAGSITSVDVIASGRNYLPSQDLTVSFSSGNASASVNTDPILYTVEVATEPTPTGLSTVTFNEFVPYSIGIGASCELVRLSRIITSSHSFEYVGAGTDLNRANPFQGGEPIPENEIVAINGGQVPFTSTDQKGNFRIGDGLTVDQTTSTIRGRDFNRAIQAQLTPLILSLR